MSAHELAERLGPLRARLPGVDVEVPMAAPETEEALIELVHKAREGELKVLPIGSGTRLGGVHGCDADLLLSTRQLTGIVAYEPGDGTVTARAGTQMSDLAEAIALGGHRLTPDVPRPASATGSGSGRPTSTPRSRSTSACTWSRSASRPNRPTAATSATLRKTSKPPPTLSHA